MVLLGIGGWIASPAHRSLPAKHRPTMTLWRVSMRALWTGKSGGCRSKSFADTTFTRGSTRLWRRRNPIVQGRARTIAETDLQELIGTSAFIRLVEEFGGTRLYIPLEYLRAGEVVEAIGHEAARLLSERLAQDTVRIPLARELLAQHYHARGYSNGQIARKLRITETGVDKLFKRARGQGRA